MVQGKEVGCINNHIKVLFNRGLEADYLSLETTVSTLDDLKRWLSHLIFYTTPRLIKDGDLVEKKKLNIAARYFVLISSSSLPLHNESTLHNLKVSYLRSLIPRRMRNLGLIIA